MTVHVTLQRAFYIEGFVAEFTFKRSFIIVDRGAARVQTARATEDQKYVNKSKSVFPYENGNRKTQSNGQSTSYNAIQLEASSFDSSSSCSLSDEAVDVGCSSSSGDDIPEINFPSILENHAEEPYDMKGYEFESFLDKGWEFLITDSDNILSSSLSPEMDVFTSPTKVSTSLIKSDPDDIFSTLSWTDDQPLFTAEDLEEIKDISSISGVNSLIQGSLEGIKFESTERSSCNQNIKIGNSFVSNMHKYNYTEPPTV